MDVYRSQILKGKKDRGLFLRVDQQLRDHLNTLLVFS